MSELLAGKAGGWALGVSGALNWLVLLHGFNRDNAIFLIANLHEINSNLLMLWR